MWIEVAWQLAADLAEHGEIGGRHWHSVGQRLDHRDAETLAQRGKGGARGRSHSPSRSASDT